MKTNPNTLRNPMMDLISLENRILYSATGLDPALLDSSVIESIDPEIVASPESESGFESDPTSSDADLNANSILESLNKELGQLDLALDFDSGDQSETGLATPAPIELIFVDQSVEDYDQLVADLMSFSDDRDFEVIIIEHDEDGVAQVSNHLEQYDQVAAIHILSHGSDGQIFLGNSVLSAETVGEYSSDLVDWSQSLTEDADLLIYGCNLGGSVAGQELLAEISELTSADVAASSDLTGHKSLGADWDLEVEIGDVSTEVAFSLQSQSIWNYTLATITVSNTNDLVNGDLTQLGSPTAISDLLADDGGDGISLREAIIAANQTAGADTIVLGAGNYLRTLAGDDDAAFLGDLDITDDLTILGDDAALTIIDAQLTDRVFQISNGAQVTIQDVSIKSGSTDKEGGGIAVGGSSASLTMERALVFQNSSTNDDGGGIHVANGGELTLTDVSIFQNQSGKDGGGLYFDGNGTLDRVTAHTNTSLSKGGGVYVDGNATVVISNSTISGNTGSEGGGLHVHGTLDVISSTIANNLASNSGKVGGLENHGGTATLLSSILSGNTSDGVISNGEDITSLGFNIDSNGSAALTHVSDLVGDPLIGALQNNGGFVDTHALMSGSIAIDAGASFGLSGMLDSNGIARNQIADVGATESMEPSAVMLYWTNSSTGEIRRGSPSGNSQLVLSGLSGPNGIQVDYENEKLYWTESSSDRVMRSNLDGTSVETFLSASEFENNPTGLTIDYENDVLYVLDSTFLGINDRVLIKSLSGGSVTTFGVGSGLFLDDIQVDSVRNKLYISDPFSGKIFASDLDGSNQTTFLSGLAGPFGLDVDQVNDFLFWTENSSGTDKIGRINLNTLVVESIDGYVPDDPNGIVADESTGEIYWTESGEINSHDGTLVSNVFSESATDVSLINLASTIPNSAPFVSTGITDQFVNTSVPFSLQVTNNFDDADLSSGDSLTLSAELSGGNPLPSWLSFDDTTGTFSGTPTNSDIGIATIEVTATDSKGLSVTEVFDVNVLGVVNSAPTSITLSNDQIDEHTDTSGGIVVGSLSTADPDSGDTHTYSILTSVDDAHFSISGNNLVFDDGIVELVKQSTYEVIVSSSDGASSVSETFQIDIQDIPDAPEIADQAFTVNQFEDNSTVVAQVVASDLDGDTLSYSIVGGSTIFTIDSGSGDISVLDRSQLGSQSSFDLTVQVSDGGLDNSATITLNIDSTTIVPTIDNTLSQTTPDTTVVNPFSSITVDDPDNSGSLVITVDLSTNDDQGLFSAASLTDSGFTKVGTGQYQFNATDAADAQAALRLLEFEPIENVVVPGTATDTTFTITIADNAQTGSDNTTIVTVNSINDAPTSISLSNDQIDEHTDTSGGIVVGSLSTADLDFGETHNYSISTSVDGGHFSISGSNLIFDDGVVELAKQTTYEVIVSSSDGDSSVSQTFQIDIQDIPDAPEIADQAFNVNQFEDNGAIVAKVLASDLDGDTLNYSIVGGSSVFAIDPNSGDIEILDRSQLGSQTSFDLTVQVSDGGLDNSATITLNIDSTTIVPNIAGTFSQVTTDTTSVSPFSSITVDDPDNSGSLVVTVELSTNDDQGQFSVASLTASGFTKIGTGQYQFNASNAADAQAALRALEFEPIENVLTPGTSADTTFTIRIADNAQTGSDNATVVTVNSINDSPTMDDQGFAIGENANDDDLVGALSFVEPDSGDGQSFAILSGNDDGIFRIDNTGNLLINDASTIDAEVLDNYQIDVQVTDNLGASDQATITINISDENDAPVANDDTFSTISGSRIRRDLVVNDLDQDGDALVAQIVSQPSNGQVKINANGNAVYVPNNSFIGFDSFTYQAFDGTSFSEIATVQIRVTGRPEIAEPSFQSASPTRAEADQPVVLQPEPQPEPTRVLGGLNGFLDNEDEEPNKSASLPIERVSSAEIETRDRNASQFASTGIRFRASKVGELIQEVNYTSTSFESSTMQLTELMNQDLEFLLDDGELTTQLVQMNSDLSVGLNTTQLVVGSATAATSFLTVGYVIWMVRSGFLVASLVSSLPAWKMIDPSTLIECFAEFENDESIEGLLSKE